MVKNTTRAVAEAGAAVKSLTGLDVAGLINDAVGRHGTADASTAGAAGGHSIAQIFPDQGHAGAAPRAPWHIHGICLHPVGGNRYPPRAVRRRGRDDRPLDPRGHAVRRDPGLYAAGRAAALLADALALVPGIRRCAEMTIGERPNAARARLARSGGASRAPAGADRQRDDRRPPKRRAK